MALLGCPECRKTVSETAEACPACGFKLTAEIVSVQKEKQNAAETVGAWIGYGLAAVLGVPILLCAGLCSGAFSSANSSSNSGATTVAPYHSASDDELMNRPSLSGYSDFEKRMIIDAAKDLDRKVQDLQRRRGY
jgi:RNA polymerase subunit RPABC4/transcription elongation factor Spt4